MQNNYISLSPNMLNRTTDILKRNTFSSRNRLEYAQKLRQNVNKNKNKNAFSSSDLGADTDLRFKAMNHLWGMSNITKQDLQMERKYK